RTARAGQGQGQQADRDSQGQARDRTRGRGGRGAAGRNPVGEVGRAHDEPVVQGPGNLSGGTGEPGRAVAPGVAEGGRAVGGGVNDLHSPPLEGEGESQALPGYGQGVHAAWNPRSGTSAGATTASASIATYRCRSSSGTGRRWRCRRQAASSCHCAASRWTWRGWPNRATACLASTFRRWRSSSSSTSADSLPES